MRNLLWIVALLAALGAGALGILAISANPSLAQAQVVALLGLWVTITPYCAARAWDELTSDRKPAKPADFSGGG